MKRSLIFAILFFASLGSLFAEAIYMRNGEILVGTITQQTERSVTVIIEGRTRVIPKSQIARITFETEEVNNYILMISLNLIEFSIE